MKQRNLARKIATGALALAMVATTMVPLPAMAAGGNYTVTIEGGNTEKDHVYEAYQVFTGDLHINEEGKSVLSNIKWGEGVNPSTLLTALKADASFGVGIHNLFYDCETARDVAEVVDEFSDDSNMAKEFADVVGSYLSGKATGTLSYAGDKYSISGLEAGYYFIKDKDSSLEGMGSAYTRYILKVANDVTVQPKSPKLTVDKSLDESEDLDVVDHAINETFQYYLTADLPASDEYLDYETYMLKFTDELSEGITFEKIDSVIVDGIELHAGTADYTVTGIHEGQQGGTWTLTIPDLKTIPRVVLTDGAKVKVTYSVHLNEKAKTTRNSDSGVAGGNNNKVKLTYSNNPNFGFEGSTGETPYDDTFVFTYEVDNTKYALTQEEKQEILAGAGFKLFDSDMEEVSLYYDSSIEAYRPTGEGEEAVENMFSAEGTGKFDIKGLLPGTYTLRETVTPAGYNTCEDIQIVINPKIEESADGKTATATFETEADAQNMDNDIINVHGSILPSTGARTIVILVAAAAICVIGGVAFKVKGGKKEN